MKKGADSCPTQDTTEESVDNHSHVATASRGRFVLDRRSRPTIARRSRLQRTKSTEEATKRLRSMRVKVSGITEEKELHQPTRKLPERTISDGAACLVWTARNDDLLMHPDPPKTIALTLESDEISEVTIENLDKAFLSSIPGSSSELPLDADVPVIEPFDETPQKPCTLSRKTLQETSLGDKEGI